MFIRRQFSISILFLFLAAPALYAQTIPTRNSQEQTAKTSIIIERQLLRFTTQGEALEWRLVVSKEQGEVIFDSGFVNATSLEWPLQNQQGEAVESGLYSYTLTTKA